MYHLAKLLK